MDADCPFESKRKGYCWCGKKLTGRQKRFCSPAHARAIRANHRWTQAKDAVKREAAWYLCANARISDEPDGNAISAVVGPLDCEGLTQAPEVNHIHPIKGKHGTWGCHHHQDGLEVLCRPCHLRVTAQQREEGLL